MTLIVNVQPNDLAILWLGQQTDTDSRVPTAEELAAGEKMLREHLGRSRLAVAPAGLRKRPTFTANSGRQVGIPELAPWTVHHPTLDAIPPNALNLQALPASTVVNRYDYIYLLAFSVLVTADLDPAIALTFQWRNGAILESVTKENTARLRDVYAYWVSPVPMTSAAIATAIGATLAVNKEGSPSGSGGYIYPLDSNLADGKTYTLVGTLEVLDLLRVWRIQGTNQNGWWWGVTNERSLEASIHLQPTYQYVGDGWDDWGARTQDSFYRLMRGESLANSPRLNRGVFNLLNGQVGANTQAPGIATISRNASTALANSQRITFTNQAITQVTFAVPTTTTDSGGGVARATLNFAGNSPSGSSFASSGHKVFGPTGTDLSSSGTFAGGGGTGALTWTASVSGTPTVGTVVYLVPAISYPAGSGLPACGAIEAVYLDAVALAAANVRETDLTGYVAPAGGDSHIVIMDRGNAAIKWIYKKFTVSSDGSGVLQMPSGARGLIAFITGSSAPAGRQDKAVITGLSNSSTYDILCYHPPEAIEQWQFQILSPVYPGLKSAAAINGAKITTTPIAIAHSLGGGTTFSPPSRPLPDGDVLGHVVAWRLPVNADGAAIRDFALDSAIALHDGPAFDSPPFQLLPALSSQGGLTGLRRGQTITAIASVDTHPQGIGVALSVDGLPLGVYKPRLASDGRYQLAIAVGLEKDGDRWFLVATFNGGTPTQGNVLAIASASPNLVGIDLFRYY
jgi:hypothetical protein